MIHILICTNHRIGHNANSCHHRQAVDVIARFTHIIQQHFAPNTFSIEQSPCLGLCHQGVNVRILAGEFLHHAHTKTDDEICAWLKTHAMPRPQPAKD